VDERIFGAVNWMALESGRHGFVITLTRDGLLVSLRDELAQFVRQLDQAQTDLKSWARMSGKFLDACRFVVFSPEYNLGYEGQILDALKKTLSTYGRSQAPVMWGFSPYTGFVTRLGPGRWRLSVLLPSGELTAVSHVRDLETLAGRLGSRARLELRDLRPRNERLPTLFDAYEALLSGVSSRQAAKLLATLRAYYTDLGFYRKILWHLSP
jgi:hypothetical protein